MKQVDKVIKKGDYYEMEVVDDGLFSMKTYKKQQMQSSLPISSDNILTDLPTYSNARSKYYYEPKNQYISAQPDVLLHELEDILVNEKLADEDKQQILKTIKQIKILKEEPLVPLINLTPANKIQEKQPKQLGEVQLKINLDLKELENKVAQLERFSYPELTSLELQLQVLLGEKKSTSLSQLPKDDRNKEQIDQLYALLSNINCAQNISGVVDRIHANDGKYTEMANWVQQVEDTSDFHLDFLAELNQDELLLNNLEANFKANVDSIKKMIEKIKKEVKK